MYLKALMSLSAFVICTTPNAVAQQSSSLVWTPTSAPSALVLGDVGLHIEMPEFAGPTSSSCPSKFTFFVDMADAAYLAQLKSEIDQPSYTLSLLYDLNDAACETKVFGVRVTDPNAVEDDAEE